MKSVSILNPRRPQVFLLLSVAVLISLCIRNLSAETAESTTLSAPHSDAEMVALAKGYEAVSGALFIDDLGSANATAYELSAEAEKLDAPRLAGLAMAVAEAKSLASARAAFKPLSEAMIQIAGKQGQYVVMVCPMEDGGRWLQSALKTQNPYMGQRMPNCGRPTVTIRSDGTQMAAPEGCCDS